MRKNEFLVAMIFFTTQAGAAISLGQVADNALGPASVLGSAFYGFCYIIGAGFFFGGLMQLHTRRRTPQAIPISRPIILMILGLIVFFLPWITSSSISAGFLQ